MSLCAMLMRSDGFDQYRCDKSLSLGINTGNLSKLLKCAGNDDVITLKSEEDTDNLGLLFESQNQERVSEFELKLMDIESEHLGIPETEYKCNVRLPAAEFQRVIRDLGNFGDSCSYIPIKLSSLDLFSPLYALFVRYHQCDQRRRSIFIIW